jgi:hypothetical protein
VLWFSAGEFDAESTHGPRIHVTLSDGVRLRDVPTSPAMLLTDVSEIIGALPRSISDEVVQFVALNRDVLLSYWHGHVDTAELFDALVYA